MLVGLSGFRGLIETNNLLGNAPHSTESITNRTRVHKSMRLHIHWQVFCSPQQSQKDMELNLSFVLSFLLLDYKIVIRLAVITPSISGVIIEAFIASSKPLV